MLLRIDKNNLFVTLNTRLYATLFGDAVLYSKTISTIKNITLIFFQLFYLNVEKKVS